VDARLKAGHDDRVMAEFSPLVMAGLVPAIYVFLGCCSEDVDARLKAGHDDGVWPGFLRSSWPGLSRPSTSFSVVAVKTWMPGSRPGMTSFF
jgi:hypothetical protein